ncbi:hypothetical protein [Otoolea muris]|nr:hypothetical protein [Otoolea muris]
MKWIEQRGEVLPGYAPGLPMAAGWALRDAASFYIPQGRAGMCDIWIKKE